MGYIESGHNDFICRQDGEVSHVALHRSLIDLTGGVSPSSVTTEYVVLRAVFMAKQHDPPSVQQTYRVSNKYEFQLATSQCLAGSTAAVSRGFGAR